ncbi:hypothetical protein DSCW_29190 [Desulfosarcina widdelii]|uniref:Uncharacterized protein n=1 Tax=Desulfosarcina widdelii TaxID=947919 RepID=A0A5K7Z0K5_9BACT|nr:hypothetical protein DSCW_29190 [Desulfosarcina widdelii]
MAGSGCERQATKRRKAGTFCEAGGQLFIEKKSVWVYIYRNFMGTIKIKH